MSGRDGKKEDMDNRKEKEKGEEVCGREGKRRRLWEVSGLGCGSGILAMHAN